MTAQDISLKGTESYKGLPQLDCQCKSIDKFNLRLIWDPKFTLKMRAQLLSTLQENKAYGPVESEGGIYSVNQSFLY